MKKSSILWKFYGYLSLPHWSLPRDRRAETRYGYNRITILTMLTDDFLFEKE